MNRELQKNLIKIGIAKGLTAKQIFKRLILVDKINNRIFTENPILKILGQKK